MAKVEKEKKEKKHFFKDFKAELKKVIWPTPKQVINNTTAVITIVLITALIVFVLDLTFETLNTQGVNRLKNIVKVNEVENSISDNSIDEHDNNTIVNNMVLDENTVPET